MAAKPHEPAEGARENVAAMASAGIDQNAIARVIGVSPQTLRKHYRDELDTGRTKTIARVAASLVSQALAGNVTAAIFYLKTQGGWSERRQAVEDQGIVIPFGGLPEGAVAPVTGADGVH